VRRLLCRGGRKKVINNAAVDLGDCTVAPAGTNSSRVKQEIASELHPRSNWTGEGFGCCHQVLPLTNVKLFVLCTLLLEGVNVIAGGYV